MAKGDRKGPRIPRSLPSFEDANKLLQDINTKLSSMTADKLKVFDFKVKITGQDEIAKYEKSLSAVAAVNEKLVKNLVERKKVEVDLTKKINDSKKINIEYEKVKKGILKNLDIEKDKIKKFKVEQQDVEKIIDGLNVGTEKTSKQLDIVSKKYDAATKSTRKNKKDIKELQKEKERLEKAFRKESASVLTAQKQLDKKTKSIESAEKSFVSFNKELNDLNKKIVENKKNTHNFGIELEKLESKASIVAKTIGTQLVKALANAAAGFLSLVVDSIFWFFEKITAAIKRIYNLLDRTTAATGRFNLVLGATTKGLDSARNEAWKLEGQMRSLTGGELGVGLQIWQETASALGYVGEKYNEVTTAAARAGRALGIGSSAAGELARTFMLMGHEGKDTTKNMVSISNYANLAGVSVADFGKEILASKDTLASFGRTGQNVFLKSAAFARRLGVSIQSLNNFMDMTDSFESTAVMAAKLNKVFGTSINSIQLLLEQDPSKRLEMVRNALKAQGKSFESLSRQEKKFLSETLKLSAEETAAIFENGLTLEQFEAQRAQDQKKKESDEKKIREGLAKTAETLMNWGQVADRITKAFMPLFKPFLKVIGLIGEFDKAGKRMNKTFSENVEQMIKSVREFFDALTKNPQIKHFIETLSSDLRGLFDAFTGKNSKKPMQGIVDGLGKAAKLMEEVYTWGRDFVTKYFTVENFNNIAETIKDIAAQIGRILQKIESALNAFSTFRSSKFGKMLFGEDNSEDLARIRQRQKEYDAEQAKLEKERADKLRNRIDDFENKFRNDNEFKTFNEKLPPSLLMKDVIVNKPYDWNSSNKFGNVDNTKENKVTNYVKKKNVGEKGNETVVNVNLNVDGKKLAETTVRAATKGP